MFTIDLLKGQGIPKRSRPGGVVVASVTLSAPLIVGIVAFGFYVSNSIAISIQKQEIVNYESKTNELSEAVESQKSFEQQKNALRSCLGEVSSSVGGHTQWSPVLTTIVESMPDSMVLTKLEVERRSVKRKVPKKDEPDRMVETSVPLTTLQIFVSGKPNRDYQEAVRDFRDRLRLSSVLGPQLENIKIERDVAQLEGQEVVSYQLNCIFKTEF